MLLTRGSLKSLAVYGQDIITSSGPKTCLFIGNTITGSQSVILSQFLIVTALPDTQAKKFHYIAILQLPILAFAKPDENSATNPQNTERRAGHVNPHNFD